ncbi:hypothetical protein Barb4_03209 [Bacteroidales bacterium Barb4]|nr:hypothetical protein Barb4_03209 [Bacteroidales bacterium Barb4]
MIIFVRIKQKLFMETNQRLYGIWHNIKSRCMNRNFTRFHYYGARGITMCDEWKEDYKAFHAWAVENGYADNLTIDRIDTNGNLELLTCYILMRCGIVCEYYTKE